MLTLDFWEILNVELQLWMKTYIVTVQNNSPESTLLNKEMKNEVFSETSLRELKCKFRNNNSERAEI